MKKDEIAISVIVPAHNLENYIGVCIESVLNQSFQNYEIILIDDCSDDNTKKIIKEYMEREKTTEIILLENDRNTNAGYSRNRGLDIARGTYLLFLDGDDMLERNALERLSAVCKETRPDIVHFNYYYLDNITCEKTEYSSPADAIVEMMKIFQPGDMGDCFFQIFREVAWDKLFRRAFIQESKIRFQSQNNANDQFFAYAAMLKAERMIKIPNHLLSYRKNRENQLSTSGNISRNPGCIWDATKAVLNYIDEHALYNLYQRSFHTYAAVRLLFSLKNINAVEQEKLFAFYRREGYEALKMMKCGMETFNSPYFYAVNDWLIHLESAENLQETENWKLRKNEAKFKNLFEEFRKENRIVLWGAGVNGGRFLKKAHEFQTDIRCVIDLDENKRGKSICGYEIKNYDAVEREDMIVVLNPDHIPIIRRKMIQQQKKVRLLDARAYLCFDIPFEQAILKI